MLQETVAALLRSKAEEQGYDVIQVKVDGRRNVRMWVDLEPGPITVDHCSRLSRGLVDALEAGGFDPGSFQLEVQSPGLDRPLTREKDFVRFAGQDVAIQLREKRGDRARFSGLLLGCEGGQVRVRMNDQELSFALDGIREARLVPRLPFANRDAGHQPRRRPKRQKRKKH